MNTLKTKLRAFKLSGMLNSLEERLSYAGKQSMSHAQFLELLCDDEEQCRQDNSYKKRYNKAKLPAHKLIENFDFAFQPSIDPKQINDLSTCQYISQKRNAVFIGSPGTGKTHLAIGLGMKALAKNYKVVFTSSSEMLYQLHISRADNSYYQKLNEYLTPDLLIIDELGFKKMASHSADDFFEVISKRYEKGSCIITTNKNCDQWAEIFADAILSAAICDRVVHHATMIKINGPSYRGKDIKSTPAKSK